jgi:hypothetical protein
MVCAKEFKPSARPSTGLITAPMAPMATPRTKPVDPCFNAPSTGLVITPVTPAATPEMTAPPPSTIPEMTPSRAASCVCVCVCVCVGVCGCVRVCACVCVCDEGRSRDPGCKLM